MVSFASYWLCSYKRVDFTAHIISYCAFGCFVLSASVFLNLLIEWTYLLLWHHHRLYCWFLCFHLAQDGTDCSYPSSIICISRIMSFVILYAFSNPYLLVMSLYSWPVPSKAFHSCKLFVKLVASLLFISYIYMLRESATPLWWQNEIFPLWYGIGN